MLDACAEILQSCPGVHAIERRPGSIVVQLADSAVVGFSRAPGWFSLATRLAAQPPADRRRQAFLHGVRSGPIRPILADGDLWARVDFCEPAQAAAALQTLRGQAPPPTSADLSALMAGSAFQVAGSPQQGGWLVSDPGRPQARAMVVQPQGGRLAVFLALHQLDLAHVDDTLVDAVLTLNDRLLVARLVPVEGLGLVAFASLAPAHAAALDVALRQLQADAAVAAEGLASPVDDPRAMLPMLRDFVRLVQSESGVPDAVIAQGVLAAAAGDPLPAALAAVPTMPAVLGALAELLLETIPGMARSGKLVMQIGLTTAAEGSRPLDEIWEVADTYLRGG